MARVDNSSEELRFATNQNGPVLFSRGASGAHVAPTMGGGMGRHCIVSITRRAASTMLQSCRMELPCEIVNRWN